MSIDWVEHRKDTCNARDELCELLDQEEGQLCIAQAIIVCCYSDDDCEEFGLELLGRKNDGTLYEFVERDVDDSVLNVYGLEHVYYDKNVVFKLKQGYTETEYNEFLDALNFDYSDGYGAQHLYGILWFDDGTWAERWAYDGSECWEIRKRPPTPDSLKRNNN